MIPAKAAAKIDFRLVPNQTHGKALEAFTKAVGKKSPDAKARVHRAPTRRP